MKIVIVGTTKQVRTGLQSHLTIQGHDVEAFDTGRQALVHLGSHGADLVLIDHTLSDMRPATVATHLRQWATEAPILVLKGGNRFVH